MNLSFSSAFSAASGATVRFCTVASILLAMARESSASRRSFAFFATRSAFSPPSARALSSTFRACLATFRFSPWTSFSHRAAAASSVIFRASPA